MVGTQARTVRKTVQGAADSRPVTWAARLGLAARGVVYVLLGLMGMLLAGGNSGAPADQKGALATLVTHPYGVLLVALLAVGFAAYSLWRLSEALIGVTGEGKAAGPRLQSAARALVYALLTGTAVSVLMGSRSTQASQQQDATARLLAQPFGQVLVGIVGGVIVVVGVALVVQGVKASFMKYFRGLPPRRRQVVRTLGRVGSTARGLVFAIVGALVIEAAVTYDPKQAAGIDGALHTLLKQPYGAVLVLIISLGLLAFGVYGLAEARYRRV